MATKNEATAPATKKGATKQGPATDAPDSRLQPNPTSTVVDKALAATTDEPKTRRSRQGVGAEKGESVRIVRRKTEETEGGPESWHIWKESTNQNVVGERFPSMAAAQAFAVQHGWVPQEGRQPARPATAKGAKGDGAK